MGRRHNKNYRKNNHVFSSAYLVCDTVEPCYKEVGYITKIPSYNKLILLVPALYICYDKNPPRGFYPDNNYRKNNHVSATRTL